MAKKIKKEFSELVQAVGQYLEEEKARGNLWVASSSSAEDINSVRKVSGYKSASLFESEVPDAEISSIKKLDVLKEMVEKCRKCPLGSLRKNSVFGEGNYSADLMFVGEAPGRDEDDQGRPFVGRAGKLLTEIISKGMKMRREDIFIANILKCRPPENRNPMPDEIGCCEPYLIRQIELIKPKVICTLGNFAARTLIGVKDGITKLRGSFFDYHGIKLMPTFHPAYLLRNYSRQNRIYVWEDMKKILKELK